MATNRSYDDLCGVARGLDLVGERWALLVVRELLLGPKRFTDLHSDLAGISTNVLTNRLEELEDSGILRRRRLPPPAGSAVYELTSWGLELDPIVCRLGRWALGAPGGPRGSHLSATAMALSLRTMFDPKAAGSRSGRYELELADQRFDAEVSDAGVAGAEFTIGRAIEHTAAGRSGGEQPAGLPAEELPVGVDAAIRVQPVTLSGVVYGGQDLDRTIRSGRLVVRGDRSAVAWFVTLFSLPEPAVSPKSRARR
ncbi:MAG: winged helix-turn-helix transcriptional regulator [Nocardioidaceae bacterium]